MVAHARVFARRSREMASRPRPALAEAARVERDPHTKVARLELPYRRAAGARGSRRARRELAASALVDDKGHPAFQNIGSRAQRRPFSLAARLSDAHPVAVVERRLPRARYLRPPRHALDTLPGLLFSSCRRSTRARARSLSRGMSSVHPTAPFRGPRDLYLKVGLQTHPLDT